jgi:hypothetical protein
MYKLTNIYKQLREEEQAAQVAQYKIYCDMDGVLCDFNRRFEQFGGMSPNEYETRFGTKKFWELITKVGEQFWSKMPWTSGGKQLWSYISKYKPSLLSAPSSDYSSRYGKKLWVQENLPGTRLILSKRENKKDYASGKSILIDDLPKNIDEWKVAGGIGILYTSTGQVINELEKLGL